jgi:MoxR-like ATPase
LVRATQAAAAIDGRTFATPDDVKAVAPLVLEHRLIARPEAELEGIDARAIVARILAAVPAPRE